MSYMTFRGNWLPRAYKLYNDVYFGNHLPEDMKVAWRKMPGYEGSTDGQDLFINVNLKKSPRLALIVLLHEMNHLARDMRGHGKAFKKGIQILVAQGAYDDLL